MPKRMPKVGIPTNLLEFPVIKAWRELRPELVQPEKIEILTGRKETARRRACRLAGVGPEGSAVIAKRLRRAKALIEHTVYEEVLQYLPIPTLRCYGLVEEKDGEFCWLFLEDAGEERYSAFTEEHRRLAARWLGLLHTSAARVALGARLPDRGQGHYLWRLLSGQRQARSSSKYRAEFLSSQWRRNVSFLDARGSSRFFGDRQRRLRAALPNCSGDC